MNNRSVNILLLGILLAGIVGTAIGFTMSSEEVVCGEDGKYGYVTIYCSCKNKLVSTYLKEYGLSITCAECGETYQNRQWLITYGEEKYRQNLAEK